MREFRRAVPWMDDDASGFGDSFGDYETKVIAGNTFDYPSVHGAAILKAGYSFVSCSDEAVEDGAVSLNDYTTVDLILGKECQTKMGRGGVTRCSSRPSVSRCRMQSLLIVARVEISLYPVLL